MWTLIGAYFNPAMRDKATTCRSTACSSRNTSVSQPLETHQKQPVPMCQSHVDARFPMERSASTKIRNPSVTLHKQACTMLSQWSVIWVGNTFPQGDVGLLRLLAVRNDLGPAPSTTYTIRYFHIYYKTVSYKGLGCVAQRTCGWSLVSDSLMLRPLNRAFLSGIRIMLKS